MKPRHFLLLVGLALFALADARTLVAQEKQALQPMPDTPLPLKQVRAFPNVRFRRPIVLTHAGDGSDRVYVASQLGTIQVFANNPQLEESQLATFLDIENKVMYKDNENEEGLLGFAFHPKFKENGQFFLYYTTRDAAHTSVVSRFRTLKGDPTKADPKSEEELLRIPQPYWNHNGGALAFGPDGHLYIALGDGGFKDDPHGHGQNLETLLGSILRIDVDHQSPGKKYAIPADNPFVGKEKAQPEIYAYGFRNVWGMAFDKETGHFWAADVGQDLWEEIDIVVKGGNHGFSRAGCGNQEIAKSAVLSFQRELLQHFPLVILRLEIEERRCGGNLIATLSLEGAGQLRAVFQIRCVVVLKFAVVPKSLEVRLGTGE